MKTEKKGKILIVDDEKNMCNYLSIILEKEGYDISTALNGREALSKLQSSAFDLIIQDIKMPGMDGIELLRRIKESAPSLPVVIMTAYSTWDTAVEAMRLGAQDFLKKPFKNQVIKDISKRLIEYRKRHKKTDKKHGATFHLSQIIGNSAIMDDIFTSIQAAARTEATVLITGESGVGKELAARALHYSSLRSEENFISINCSALVSTLLENEIFGHTKGAFTGAEQEKKGLLEVTHKGTFFLDEIGDLEMKLQGKILKVLEDREFYPVGSTEKKYVDIRFIAATNQDLETLIENDKFRRDLYYRINVIPIYIPPLKERKDDIPLLAGYFLNKYSKRYKKNVSKFSEEALSIMASNPWPGNVRELENFIQRAIISATSETIESKDFASPSKIEASVTASLDKIEILPGFNLENELQETEKRYIEKALTENNFRLTKAAESLGMTFRGIRYKIKKYNIDTKKR